MTGTEKPPLAAGDKRWLELSVQAPGEYAETLSSLFARHADGVYAESPGGYNPDEGEFAPADAPVTIRGYLPIDATTETRRAMIDVGIRLISYLSPLAAMTEREMDQSEWANQSFEPIRVGKRLVIVPPSALARDPLSQRESEKQPLTETSNADVGTAPDSGAYALLPGDVVIPLEPGLAFGTGHHPTTSMMLTSMEQLVTPGCRVLDVGCGSGILMIAAMKLGAGLVVGCDVEDDAILSSRRNLALAGIDSGTTVFQGSLPSPEAPEDSFDLVLANISAVVIKKLAADLLKPLHPDGTLLASGILEPRMNEVVETLEAAGGRLTDHEITGDWCRLSVQRR